MTEDALREHVRASLGCYFHPVGTCALGSVVDGDGKVRGLNGVHVADCSIMPAIPRANTHLSALAVRAARRQAPVAECERILRSFSSSGSAGTMVRMSSGSHA